MSGKNIEGSDRIVLIMFPFAGGSAQSYYKFAKSIIKRVDIQIVSIEYAGHGTRFRSQLVKNFDELVNDAKKQIVNIIEKYIRENDNLKIILFGHSMGGIVAAHVSNEIFTKYNKNLKGIVLSSCLPPEKIRDKETIFQTNQELIDYLCVTRNVPVDLANSEEFIQLILPYVKNDFRILGEYNSKLCCLPKCSVYGIWANLDYGINKTAMIGWQSYSILPIVWYEAEGTHFYFEENETSAVNILVDIIDKIGFRNLEFIEQNSSIG